MLRCKAVAPYVGAWIETFMQDSLVNAQRVAPYVGAWIETLNLANKGYVDEVAPYVGAWIETAACIRAFISSMSHPTWVRGLKQVYSTLLAIGVSRTLRGCVD